MTKPWLAIGPLATLGAALAVACSTFTASEGSPDAGAADGASVDGALPGDDAAAPDGSSGPEAPSGVVPVPVPVVTAVATLAGFGTPGFSDGLGTATNFNAPAGVAVDAAGNVYVADTLNERLRKVTATGVVTTLAGSGTATFANGTGAAASFSGLLGVSVDATGKVYVADTENNCIRAVSSAGAASTLAGLGINGGGFADGAAAAARFNIPGAVVVTKSGDLYVADAGNSRIRKVTSAGVVTTLAGSGDATFVDGTGAAASFNNPSGIAADGAGNLYVADLSNHRVRKVTPAGVVTTFAGSGAAASGDGAGAVASFTSPSGVAVDVAGNVYVADDRRMRRVTPGGVVTTLAGRIRAGSRTAPARPHASTEARSVSPWTLPAPSTSAMRETTASASSPRSASASSPSRGTPRRRQAVRPSRSTWPPPALRRDHRDLLDHGGHVLHDRQADERRHLQRVGHRSERRRHQPALEPGERYAELTRGRPLRAPCRRSDTRGALTSRSARSPCRWCRRRRSRPARCRQRSRRAWAGRMATTTVRRRCSAGGRPTSRSRRRR